MSDELIDKILIELDEYIRSSFSGEYGLPIEDYLPRLRAIVRRTIDADAKRN